MLVLGNFQHTLDDKNRIRLPSDFRKAMGNDYMLMPGTNGSIFVYRAEDAEKLVDKMQNAANMDPDVTMDYTQIMAFSRVVSADSQGRFMLPQDLLDIMQIEKDVRVIGTGTRAEIWSEQLWQEHFGNLRAMNSSTFNSAYKNLNSESRKK